jgi:hypothetical protein
MPRLSRGRISILWLAACALLFSSSGSAWRDLVSSPAGTVVHVSVKGGEIVPLLKGLALMAVLIAIASLFANRLMVFALSVVTGFFALATLVSALAKMGSGPDQVGVTAHFFWLPALVGVLGSFGVVLLALITPGSAKAWPLARYREGEASAGAGSDLWRAQDAGADPTEDGPPAIITDRLRRLGLRSVS